MAQIPGKYQLTENRNFYEFLLEIGVPEEKAKQDNEIKGTIVVTVDGDKIKIKSDNPPIESNLVVGKEVEESVRDRVILSTTELEGNTIKVTCKTTDGQPAGTRTMTFSENGLEQIVTAIRQGKSLTTIRIYKRI